MSKEFTGILGIVVIPDSETQKILVELSKKHSQEGDPLPSPHHLSLYHGHFKNVPEDVARQLLQQISAFLGTNYSLNQIEPYGGKFLFWNVEKPYPQLQHAHEVAVESLSLFVDREKVGLALKEGLKMTQQETENLKKYSYPLVKEIFMPHFALLYRESGQKTTGNRQHTARITEVQFVEIGGYSKINQVLFTSQM